jgi:hypothetical protein
VSYLSDTNVSLRWAHPLHPDHLIARKAIETLLQAGEKVYVTPQNVQPIGAEMAADCGAVCAWPRNPWPGD